jgi:uncharacterized integral membrane protein
MEAGLSPNESDRRKMRWLVIGFGCYFLLAVFALPRASALPYQIFALCGVPNFAIMGAFIFSIRKAYLTMKGLQLPASIEVDESTTKLRMDFDRRRLKGLWIGVALYSLIFLNGLRLGLAYVDRLPLVVIVLGEILNGSILTAFILEIRKVNRRLESRPRQ